MPNIIQRRVLYAPPAVVASSSPIAYINSASKAFTSASSGATTTGFDSSGGNFAVIFAAWYSGLGGSLSITDSKTNSYTQLTVTDVGNIACAIYVCANATVGSAHTFSASGTNAFGAISAGVFSNVLTSSPTDQQAGGSGTSTTPSTAGVTPSEANTLVIFGSSMLSSLSFSSVNGGFTLATSQPSVDSTNVGASLAYLIQTTATAADPDMTISGSSDWSARIANFKRAA
jgi:hypothetical protein